MTLKYFLSTLILFLIFSAIAFSQESAESQKLGSSVTLPQAGTILLGNDSFYQGNSSRIFYGFGFKSKIQNIDLGYFVFNAKYFPQSSLYNENSIIAITLGLNSQLPLTENIYTQMGFMIGMVSYVLPSNGGSADAETSFAWEGNIGLIHELSEKLALEFNVGYLKSQTSPISGFIIQTGIVQNLSINKDKVKKINELL